MTSFALMTLGCKVNQEEGAAIASCMRDAGYIQTAFNQTADIYIINTCTVTHVADSKSRQMINRAVKKNPDALIVVTGCYAQTGKEAVAALQKVDIICGNIEKAKLVGLIEDKLAVRSVAVNIAVGDILQVHDFVTIPGIASQERARAYLKVEDGCEQFCAYCIVPYARGPVRSLPLTSAIAEAKALVAAGHSEIVLSGIHVGAYGRDIGSNICELLRALLEIEGLLRIRISSIEPLQITDELLTLMTAEPRICRHLHIPLQSGTDKILSAMGRQYDTAAYRDLCRKLRDTMPDIAISTDIMTGFPGESDDDFSLTLDFVQEIAFASAHIFSYSKRAGTKAAEMPNQVAEQIKDYRAKQLTAITDASGDAYRKTFIGREVMLLPEIKQVIEGKSYIFGHTDNFLPVLCEWEDDIPQGLISCRIYFEEKSKLLARPS